MDQLQTSVTLAKVAGRRLNVLSAVATPLYVAGAVVTHGLTRWVMIFIAVILVLAGVFQRRPTLPWQAPYTLAVSAALTVMWGWLAPETPFLTIASLAATTVYTALMLPRPHAEVGVAVMPMVSAAAQVACGLPASLVPQAIGVISMDLALGLLLLGIRITTESRVNERTEQLAALNTELDRLTRTDVLTGLANRRQLDEALGRAWAHARERGCPLSVIMVDIDHFKRYNDHYGHLGGDACLRRVATALTAAVGEDGLAARYGGEEFAVVVALPDREGAVRVAERIRSHVADLRDEHPGTPGGIVTVSVGVASAVPGDRDTAQDLVEQADRGLYEAKRSGRNRVGIADPPTGRPAMRPGRGSARSAARRPTPTHDQLKVR